jgi:hypothetical protein
MSEGLKELAERKQELLLESDINRQIIALELSQLRLKSRDWRRNLVRAGAIYKWVAPLAGLGFGFFTARQRARKAQAKAHHNGHGKFSYMSLLAPLGATAVRQAFQFWQHARRRHQSSSAE